MPDTKKPNVVLIISDQFRADCLSIAGHPVVQTPWLDSMAGMGVRCSSAYSACPVCVPARRTLMTGQRPRTHGMFNNAHVGLPGNPVALAEAFTAAGYQAHRTGKLHIGFGEDEASAGFESIGVLRPEALAGARGAVRSDMGLIGGTQGASKNGWVVRHWPFPEHEHPVKRCTDAALNFLEHRDPRRPFFLNVSYLEPHPPILPPLPYFEDCLRRELPAPPVGDWARVFDGPRHGIDPEACRVCLPPELQRRYQAGYYAQVNHLDHEIGRLLYHVRRNFQRDTIIAFCADHGEMLGDHQWTRKQTPYEGSARIPWLMEFPKSMGVEKGAVCRLPVELMDMMPTLLDAAGISAPDSVEGASLLPILRGEKPAWREYLHGECSNMGGQGTGMQYLTDGRWKYVWLPGWNREQLFDLQCDPDELNDLAAESVHSDMLVAWRKRLIQELASRPEGFTDGHRLIPLPGPTAGLLPGLFPQGKAGRKD